MPNSLPPPTPQQNFCRRWTTSVWVSLSSHREEQPQWGSVTVTVCWSNIWSPTPAFLLDPGIWSAGPQWGPGSRRYMVLHAGRLLPGSTAWGAQHLAALSHTLISRAAIICACCWNILSWHAWPALAPPLSVDKVYKVWKSSSSSWTAVRFLPAGVAPGSDKQKAAWYFLASVIKWCVALIMIRVKPVSVLPSASAEACSSPRNQGFDDGRSPRKWTENFKGHCCSCTKCQIECLELRGQTTDYYTDQLKLAPSDKECIFSEIMETHHP